MTPTWVVVVAWCALALAAVSALMILADIFVRRYRQRMWIMEAVWPITGLYLGPVAVWLYLRFGRPQTETWLHAHGRDEAPDKPRWASIAVGVSHCGAGCALADIIVAWTIFAAGLQLAGRALYPEYIGEYLAALALGIVFQYFAIAPMRGLGLRDGLAAAAKADVLSLTAFQVGMFGTMAISSLLVFADAPLHPSSPVYWLVMQIGMIVGFATSWPANVWLIDRGIKEVM